MVFIRTERVGGWSQGQSGFPRAHPTLRPSGGLSTQPSRKYLLLFPTRRSILVSGLTCKPPGRGILSLSDCLEGSHSASLCMSR